jgi:hypothetical protein
MEARSILEREGGIEGFISKQRVTRSWREPE